MFKIILLPKNTWINNLVFFFFLLLWTCQDIIITVEDINDNKPEFDRDSYSAAIREVRWKLCIIILLVEDFFMGLGFLSSELKVLQSKYCMQINIPWLVTKT